MKIMNKSIEKHAIRFGKRLRQLREARGLTQNQLGLLIGRNSNLVAQFECATRTPSFPSLMMLAKALGVSLSEFDE